MDYEEEIIKLKERVAILEKKKEPQDEVVRVEYYDNMPVQSIVIPAGKCNDGDIICRQQGFGNRIFNKRD